MVEGQPRGGDIGVRGVQDRSVGGGEVLGARSAEVVFRGPQAVPVGGGFHPTGIDRDQVVADAEAFAGDAGSQVPGQLPHPAHQLGEPTGGRAQPGHDLVGAPDTVVTHVVG
jgi:hypothetical protein